jgi:hypothetical protein
MLRQGRFDYILFSNRIYQLMVSGYQAEIVDKYNELFELVQNSNIPVFILDQNDGTAIDYELIKLLNAQLYFKRDCLPGLSDKRIIPLNVCYSQKYIPDNIDTQRTNTLFWIGKGYCGRTKYLDACGEIAANDNLIRTEKTEIVCNQKQYSDRLLTSKIGLSLFGYGFDCLRYYELPAHGLLLFSQRPPVIIENDYTDGQNAMFFDTISEMKIKLRFMLADEDFVDKARIKGREWMLKYHTTKVRAKQLIDKINAHI